MFQSMACLMFQNEKLSDWLTDWLTQCSDWLSDKVTYWAVRLSSGQLKSMTICQDYVYYVPQIMWVFQILHLSFHLHTNYTAVNIEAGLCTFSFQKCFFDILPIECVNHKYWIHHAGNLARLQEILLVDKIRPHWYATLQINFLRGSKVYLMVGCTQYRKLLISKGLCTTQACYTLQLDPRYHTYFIWDLNVIGMDFLFGTWKLLLFPAALFLLSGRKLIRYHKPANDPALILSSWYQDFHLFDHHHHQTHQNSPYGELHHHLVQTKNCVKMCQRCSLFLRFTSNLLKNHRFNRRYFFDKIIELDFAFSPAQ